MRIRNVVAFFLAGVVNLPFAVHAYPERPVRIIALNPPGGVSDTIARALGERLT